VNADVHYHIQLIVNFFSCSTSREQNPQGRLGHLWASELKESSTIEEGKESDKAGAQGWNR
jgi:hypothetical protein